MTALPYLSSPGNIEKALSGIKTAAVPSKVSQDFVKTILKISGGSGDQMTSFLKKLGLAGADGSPSELYKQFRNPSSSGQAMAQCIKIAYAPLFRRNEFCYSLDDKSLNGLILEETGSAKGAQTAKLTFSCFKNLKIFADFDGENNNTKIDQNIPIRQEDVVELNNRFEKQKTKTSEIGLNLGYTINLNLPATTDVAVFDAIFKSLKENLLREDDA